MRIGVLTGGGDCPGLNAVIRAIWRRSTPNGHEVLGFRYGWKGLLEDDAIELDESRVRGLLHQGGTILRTSGDNPLHYPDGPQRVLDTMARREVDALIVIGGEGTMKGASHMHEAHGLPVIGVPKTIDNDLPGTDITFGFDSAVNVATEAIDRLHTTAEAHDRVMVVEVMGRTAGWIALYSGIAGGADVILIDEMQPTIEEAAAIIRKRHEGGRTFSLVVVGEGYEPRSSGGRFDDVEVNQELDAYGFPRLGGVSHVVATAIEQLTGYETRVTILGHTQRGGTPSPFDRVLASRFGKKAADLAQAGEFGRLVALRGMEIEAVPIAESTGPARVVPKNWFDLARTFMG